MRTLVIAWAGLVLIAVTGYWASLPAASARSPEFIEQCRITFDAISRLDGTSGFATSLARLEAERELDKLQRLAKSPFEDNSTYVLSNYYFRVQMARAQPTKKAQRELAAAWSDAWRTQY